MKEILNALDIALKDQSKDRLANYQKQLNFLLKGLKFCNPITVDLLIKITERLNVNSNTSLKWKKQNI